MKILIAVRSKGMTDLLAVSLSMHEIHTCATGTDALAGIEAYRPDALILDLMLPGIDGCTVLRSAGFRPPIILALTNLATPAVLQAAADAGVQDLILIPCKVRHILDHLDALIKKAPSPEV